MKKTFQLFFSIAILSLASLPTFAQGGPGGGRPGGRGMMDSEQRVERQAAMMRDSLGLTDELTAEIKEVLTIYTKKMVDARTEANGDRESMRSAMQNMRKEQNEELAAILGEEKWAQWEAITANMGQGMRGQRDGGGQGKKKGKKKDTRTDNN